MTDLMLRSLDSALLPPSSAPAAGGVAVAGAAQLQAAKRADPPPPTREQVAKAVEQANAALASANRSIEFAIDPDTHAVIVRLIDRQDNDRVLRQVPSPEMLEIAKALDRLQGVLLNNQA